MGWISLNKIDFFAYHGYYAEERQNGNQFLIDISVKTDFSPASLEDDLPGTVNYEALYEIAENEMKQPKKLLETLASNIANSILEKFPDVEKVKVEVFKKQPPISGKCESSSVKIKLKR